MGVSIYSSPAQANGELYQKLKNALRIIERGPNLDENGRRIGEKVVAIFPFYNADKLPDPNRTIASVLWTNKNNFGSIESASMENVLEFEKGHGN